MKAWIIILRFAGMLLFLIAVVGGFIRVIVAPGLTTWLDAFDYVLPILGGMAGAAICFGVAAGLQGLLSLDEKLNAAQLRPAAVSVDTLAAPVTIAPEVNSGIAPLDAQLTAPEPDSPTLLDAPAEVVTVAPEVIPSVIPVDTSLTAPDHDSAADLDPSADLVTAVPEVLSPVPSSNTVSSDQSLKHRPLSPKVRTLTRSIAAVALTVIAVIAMSASANFFQPGAEWQYLAQGAVTFLIGGLALGGALRLSKRSLQTLAPSHDAFSSSRGFWWIVRVVLGIVLLAVVSEISGRHFQLQELQNVNAHVQFLMWVAGILLVGWGLAGKIRLNLSSVNRKTAALLGVIILIGLVVRVWGLDTTARFMQDETIYSDDVKLYWNDGNPPGLLFSENGSTLTFVYPYLNMVSVEIFGRNLIGLRMASALLGLLAVPAAYGLTKILFNKKLALMAALFVATFPPDVHFSRMAWWHMGDPLFGLLTLMFVARGLKWNRRADWAFAGVSLGLTQYFYEVGRLLYPPLIIAWVVLLIICWNMKSYRRGLLIALIGAVLVAAPVYYSVFARGEQLTPRLNSVSTGTDYWKDLFANGLTDQNREVLLHRLTTPLLVYMQYPDSGAEYYGGFEGFVSPPLVPLFFLGVFWVIWRARYPVAILVVALLLVSFANIFASDPGIAPRYMIVIPMIPILMAIGLYGVLDLLWLNRRWLLALSAVAVALWQVYFYFGIHLPYYNDQRRRISPEHDIFDAVLRTTDLPVDTEVFLLDASPNLDYGRAEGLYTFLQDHPYPIQNPPPADFAPEALPHDHDYAFFIAPDDVASLDKVREAFPDVSAPIYSTYPEPAWDEYVMLLWLPSDKNSPPAPTAGG